MLFEDGFVNVAEALELPSVVNEFVVSELLASGTPSLLSCGGLRRASSVGLLLLSLEKSFHLDRFSIVMRFNMAWGWMIAATMTMGKTTLQENHQIPRSRLKGALVPRSPSPEALQGE